MGGDGPKNFMKEERREKFSDCVVIGKLLLSARQTPPKFFLANYIYNVCTSHETTPMSEEEER